MTPDQIENASRDALTAFTSEVLALATGHPGHTSRYIKAAGIRAIAARTLGDDPERCGVLVERATPTSEAVYCDGFLEDGRCVDGLPHPKERETPTPEGAGPVSRRLIVGELRAVLDGLDDLTEVIVLEPEAFTLEALDFLDVHATGGVVRIEVRVPHCDACEGCAW